MVSTLAAMQILSKRVFIYGYMLKGLYGLLQIIFALIVRLMGMGSTTVDLLRG